MNLLKLIVIWMLIINSAFAQTEIAIDTESDAPIFINTLTQNCSAPNWAVRMIKRKNEATCLDSWNYFAYNKQNRYVITPDIRKYQRTISTIDEAYTDTNKVIEDMHNQLSNIVAIGDIKGMAKKYAWKKALNPTFGVDKLDDIPIIKDMLDSNELFESLSEKDKADMAKKIRDVILSQIEAKVGDLPASTKQAVKILDVSQDIMFGKLKIGAQDIVNAMRDVAKTAVALRGAYDTITAHKKMREPMVVQYYLDEYYKQLSNGVITNNYFNGSKTLPHALQYISENNVLPYHSLAFYDGFDFDGYEIDVDAVSQYINKAKLSIKKRAKVKLKQDSYATITMTMQNRFTQTGQSSSFELNITNSGYWNYKDINLTVLFPTDKVKLNNWDTIKREIETEIHSNGLAVGQTISKRVEFTALASTYDDIEISAEVTLNSIDSVKTTSYQSAKLYFDSSESDLFIENDLTYRMVIMSEQGKQHALSSNVGSIKIYNTSDKPISIMNMKINDNWLKLDREPTVTNKGMNFWSINGEVKDDRTLGKYGDDLVIPPHGYMISGKSQSFLNKDIEKIAGDYISKEISVLVKKEDGTTTWVTPHSDPVLLHVEDYKAYKFLQGSEDIKIVLEKGTGVKDYIIPIQIEQQLLANGILYDSYNGWSIKLEDNHNMLDTSKRYGNYFTSDWKLVDGKWTHFGDDNAVVDFNIILNPNTKDLDVGVYESNVVVDIGYGLRGLKIDSSYRETVTIKVALHVIPKPTQNTTEQTVDEYTQTSDKQPNELNITLPSGATVDEATHQITAPRGSVVSIAFDDSFATEYEHGFTQLAYRIEGSDHVYMLNVRNSGEGQIEFTVPNGASFEILYVEDSLGNRYSLSGVNQVLNESEDNGEDNGTPNTCPDGATDIACEVGVHVVSKMSFLGKGSTIEALKVLGNYVYIADRFNGFQIIDISNPYSPNLVSSVSYGGTSTSPKEIYIIENYAYITYGTRFVSIDISDKKNPKVKGDISIGNYIDDIVILDKYVYITARDDGIKILDISEPTNPKIIKTISFTEKVYNLKIYNNYMYITQGSNTLQILNISNRLNPIYISSLTLDIDYIKDITVIDNAVCVVGGEGLYIINTLDIHNLEISSKLTNPHLKSLKKIYISGNYAYITGYDTFSIVNISNLNKPLFLNANYGNQPRGINISGNYAYIGEYGKLVIYDISNPLKSIRNRFSSVPTKDKEYMQSLSSLYNIQIKNSVAYLSSWSGIIYGLNIEKPLNPIFNNYIKIDRIRVNTSLVSDYMYVVDGYLNNKNRLNILDISNSSEIIKRGVFITNDINDFKILKKYALLLETNNDLEIIDISNPDNPFSISKLNIPYTIKSIDILEDYAYIIDDLGHLSIINILDKNNPILERTIFTNESYKKIKIFKKNIYLIGSEGFKIIDISNPENPIVKSFIDTSGLNISLNKEYVYIQSRNGVKVLDISNLSNPILLGSFEIGKQIHDILITENYLFALGERSDLTVINKKNLMSLLAYNALDSLVLKSETPNDNSIKNETYQKSWTFSADISAYNIEVLSSSFSSYTSLTKNGNTVSVTLTPNNTQAINEIKLQFKDADGNIVKVGSSPTFWAVSKTNHAPRLADGQVTQMVGTLGQTVKMMVKTYDADDDSVNLSIVESDGGSVSFVGDELVASFSDTKTIHHVQIQLDDGKEQVVKTIAVLRFDANSIENFYADIETSTYRKSILFATLNGVVWGEPNPDATETRLFRPSDNASWAEALKMIVNALAIAKKIELPKEGNYLKIEPAWATPYYSLAREVGGIANKEGIDLNGVYPTREEIATLLVKVLKLDEKIRDLTIDNNPFLDEEKFSSEKMFNYGKIVNFFGLFMTKKYAIADSKIRRGELAQIISKIFMIPSATIKVPTTVEYGSLFNLELIDKKALKVSDKYKLIDSSSELNSSFLINRSIVEATNVDSSMLNIGSNRIISLLDNHGVRELLFSSIIVNYSDADSDGVQDSEDRWKDDARYSVDANNNGIPDVLDEFYDIGDKGIDDSIVIGGESVAIADLMAEGRHLDGEFYREVDNVIDTDNDGIPDNKELELGLNPNSNDSDGDGYLDSEEIGDINNPRNTDETDEIDALDTDSDNDGVLDRVEREEGTDYLDDGDKPETLGIILEKSSVKLGLGLRDKNITINISDMQGGELKVTVTTEEQAMLTTTQQWADDWLSASDYEEKELLLTLKGLKAESGLISIEVRDRFGHTKTEDIVVEVIEIADFVENQTPPAHLEDVNQSCIDMGARLPTKDEINNAYYVVDNYIPRGDSFLWTSTKHPTQSGYFIFTGRDEDYPWSNASFYTARTHCVKVDKPIDTDLVTVKLNAGWNNVALSPMTLEELIEKIGDENLLIIQGALPQSSYRKLFVDQGRAYLNSFKKIEYGQGYWIKLNEAVEFTYSKVKYSGTQEVALKAGWNNIASLYGLSLEEIQANLGVDNVLIIQGALPQSSYRKLFVDQGRAYLNSFKKFEPNQGYWIKLDHEAKLVYEF